MSIQEKHHPKGLRLSTRPRSGGRPSTSLDKVEEIQGAVKVQSDNSKVILSFSIHIFLVLAYIYIYIYREKNCDLIIL